MTGNCLNSLKTGNRVWAEWGLREHGHKKVNVPPKTAGTISSKWNEYHSIDNPLYTVNWDSGQQSVHYGGELVCIAQCRTLEEFHQMILKEALNANRIVGPQGGSRGFTIHLRNGDRIENYYPALLLLDEAKIPINIEAIPRKPRRDSK